MFINLYLCKRVPPMNMRLLGGGARYIGAILCSQKGYSPGYGGGEEKHGFSGQGIRAAGEKLASTRGGITNEPCTDPRPRDTSSGVEESYIGTELNPGVLIVSV